MDNVWENIYQQGQQLNRYPWDCVVSFVYRHAASQGLSLKDMRILEVGCGSASNLWFAAREGATVYGTDYSESAINFAKKLFKDEGLKGEFSHCALPDLPPLPTGSFDCIIDRACLVVCDDQTVLDSHKALAALLKPNGKFLSTFYGQKHSSYQSGEQLSNGLTTNIKQGALVGIGPVAFYDHDKINRVFSKNWNTIELTNKTNVVVSSDDDLIHEEWHMVATPLQK